MEDIYDTIRNYNPGNAEITNKTYANRVNTFMNSGIDIQDYDKSIGFLRSKYSQKTYKSYLTSLVVYLKATGKMDLAEKYGKEMKTVNDIIQNKEKEHIATPKEKENMISRAEIKAVIDNLKSQLDKSAPKRDAYSYLDLFQKYMVVNLYYLIPPLRNDFIGCEVYDNPIWLPDTNKNYIYLNTGELVLNRYKTSKKYGKNNITKLPEELVKIVRNWIEIRNIVYPGLVDNPELLINKFLQPMSQVSLTQYLNRIFTRNISTTMLRKSYLSEKYPVTHTTSEMQRDADAMKHSIAVQQTIYRKK